MVKNKIADGNRHRMINMKANWMGKGLDRRYSFDFSIIGLNSKKYLDHGSLFSIPWSTRASQSSAQNPPNSMELERRNPELKGPLFLGGSRAPSPASERAAARLSKVKWRYQIC
ncbi:hypothetical protein SDJN03_29619, partial [Cucurbita argyrosperma subsp. sororia]